MTPKKQKIKKSDPTSTLKVAQKGPKRSKMTTKKKKIKKEGKNLTK